MAGQENATPKTPKAKGTAQAPATAPGVDVMFKGDPMTPIYKVKNTTGKMLTLRLGGTAYEIKAGETLKMTQSCFRPAQRVKGIEISKA